VQRRFGILLLAIAITFPAAAVQQRDEPTESMMQRVIRVIRHIIHISDDVMSPPKPE
jgi:hypothetical protein